MEDHTSALETDAAVYRSDQSFDIRTGMAVYDRSGQLIGSVREIAGFGSTQVDKTSDDETSIVATQARTGTGYIRVDRTTVLGPGAADIYVPFPGIEEVTSEAAVILNTDVVSELSRLADRTQPSVVDQVPAQRSGWRRWLPGTKP
jgi:hypothetical protein